MIRILKYTIVLLLLLAAGCVKDNGNYDYETLTPIEIDMKLPTSTVVIKQLGRLVITPTVKQGSGAENLSYRWQLRDDLSLPDPDTGYFIDEELSTEQALDVVIDFPARSYHLIYYVTDKTNGVTVSEKLKLKVETRAPQGLMVLHETDDRSDVSMLMNPEVNAGIEGYADDYTTHAVFSGNNNGLKPGKGVRIVAPRGNGNHIYLFQQGVLGGYRLSITDMKVVSSYAECFREGVSPVSYVGFNSHYAREFLVNDGAVYFCDCNVSGFYPGYDVKSICEDELGYKAAPYIGVCGITTQFGAFYDQKNRRFMRIDNQLMARKFVSKGDAFDASQPMSEPLEMLYADMGFPDKRWHCIMYNPEKPSVRNIYDLDLSAYGTSAGNKTGVAIHKTTAATDIALAEFFAFGTRGPVMFYGTQQKIYRYLYESATASEVLLDLTTTYPGYEVSHLWMFNDDQANKTHYGKLLYVAIWSPGTSDGKLLQYLVSETNGTVELGPKVYEGFGKITSLGYKWK